MRKQNLLKKLILVITVLTCTVSAYGYAEVEQTVTLSVQPSVSIEKITSNESGTINPKTGIHTGLSASFKLQTNGTDDDYDFIVGSKINTIDGEVSAYTDTGALLFGNATALPTVTAVENAKTGGNDNRNVIAYPISINITNPMEVSYDPSKTTSEGNGCYVVKINTGTEGTLTQTISSSPVANTYSIGSDEAGTYRSTVYFTAISK